MSSSDKISKRRVLKALTTVQNVSASIFAAFLGSHLLAPISAIVGGVELADLTMLTSRDYAPGYQRCEAVFLASGVLHVVSSAMKRILQKQRRITAHTLSAWLLVPLTWLHFVAHRARPRRLGIAHQVSYQLVSHNLQQAKLLNGLQYMALTALATYHSLAGIRHIAQKRPAVLGTKEWKVACGSIVGAVGLGLARLQSAPTPAWLATRYDRIGTLPLLPSA